ncbi:MAG: aminotransferase class IV [Bacteroidetes bacterium]|nr:aminotransferase class IV [Bacteroidota bacterium]
MSTANFLFLDGQIHRSNKLLVSPNNRSFRYGDGFFETMKWMNGRVLLADYHFERLFASLNRLQFQVPNYFTKAYLENQINELVKKNGHTKLARVRITIYRGEGGLYEVENHFPHHLIQTYDLNPSNNQLNENGLVVDLYRDAIKVCDSFSHIKSNNYLNYAMAAIWAKKQHLNDAFLFNPYNRLADATIANVFLIKDGLIKTPAITEGPVQGVMRRYLLQALRAADMPVEETAIELSDIEQASEIFLTNAIYGIRWVKQFGKHSYTQQLAPLLHKKMVQTTF